MKLDAELIYRLQRLEERVRVATDRMRAIDTDPDLSYRGLYITDEQVDRLLDQGATGAHGVDGFTIEPLPETGPLRRLADSFGLIAADLELLIIALAPDLDTRFERFYGYLHDDVTRRRASPGR